MQCTLLQELLYSRCSLEANVKLVDLFTGFQHEDHCLAVPDHVRTPIHHCSLLICALLLIPPIHAVSCRFCSVNSKSPRLAPQVKEQRTNKCNVLHSISSE